MVQELMDVDFYKQEILYLDGLTVKQAKVLARQDTMILMLRKKEINCQQDLMTCNELRDSLELQNITLQKNLKTKTRAKRFWLITALAAATSAVLIHYSWKGDL